MFGFGRRTPRALRFTQYVHLRFTAPGSDPTFKRLDKIAEKEVIRGAGCRATPTLRTFASLEELDFEGLPERFVLKPTHWHSTKGVMVLARREDGLFYEMISKRLLSLEEIQSEQRRLRDQWAKRNRSTYSLMAEAIIEDEMDTSIIPYDYKCDVFGGEVVSILQVNRNATPPSWSFMDGNFEPWEEDSRFTSDWKIRSRGTPRKPARHAELTEAVRKMAGHLQTPFVRIDAYASADGPVIGELTFTPGPAYYGNQLLLSDAYDLELGQRWHDAATRLGLPAPHLPPNEDAPAARYRDRLLKEALSKPSGRSASNFALACRISLQVMKNFFRKRPLLELVEISSAGRHHARQQRRNHIN